MSGPVDLAVVGNGRIAALINSNGQLVWWCFPGSTAIRFSAA
jgi:hypothetical protein